MPRLVDPDALARVGRKHGVEFRLQEHDSGWRLMAVTEDGFYAYVPLRMGWRATRREAADAAADCIELIEEARERTADMEATRH